MKLSRRTRGALHLDPQSASNTGSAIGALLIHLMEIVHKQVFMYGQMATTVQRCISLPRITILLAQTAIQMITQDIQELSAEIFIQMWAYL